jgi:hypothetical protein
VWCDRSEVTIEICLETKGTESPKVKHYFAGVNQGVIFGIVLLPRRDLDGHSLDRSREE